MSEYITLLGAEDVRSAGSSMRVAASEMQAAANSIDNSLNMLQRFLDDWLIRFEESLKDANN